MGRNEDMVALAPLIEQGRIDYLRVYGSEPRFLILSEEYYENFLWQMEPQCVVAEPPSQEPLVYYHGMRVIKTERPYIIQMY